jgi:hypothetical protein
MRDSGARYNFGLSRLRIRARNDDQTIPTPANMIGGAGPFDFSGAAAPAAVTAFIKKNGEAVKSFTIDLDDAGITIGAVTVDQLVSAITAGLAAATPAITGYAASKVAATGRAKFVLSSPASGDYVQVWGEAFELAMFGQGKGLKAVCSDTAQTINFAPDVKADTRQTVTDANMKDTEVIIEGYKKGWTGKLVDTVEDFEMMELVESGSIDTDGSYLEPDSSTKKVSFEIETYNPIYQRGTNLEDEIVGWEHIHALSVKGSVGEDALAGGHRVKTYDLVGVNYKDAAGVESGARKISQLALTAWSPKIFDAMVAVEPEA